MNKKINVTRSVYTGAGATVLDIITLRVVTLTDLTQNLIQQKTDVKSADIVTR